MKTCILKYYFFISVYLATFLFFSCSNSSYYRYKIDDFSNTSLTATITDKDKCFIDLKNNLIVKINNEVGLNKRTRRTAINIVSQNLTDIRQVFRDDAHTRYGNITNEFLNYMPLSPYEFKIPNVYSEEYSTIIESSVFHRIHFKVKSSQFSHKFQFPTDYLYCTIYKDYNNQKDYKPFYLILDLPEYISVNSYWDMGPGYDPNNYGYGQRYIQLKKSRLLLNPAFSVSYDESTKYIWGLYLFKIKYNILGDTLQCSHKLQEHNTKSDKDSPFWSFPCKPDFFSQNVKAYLATAIKDDPEMYISYFKLIFWEIYQPKNFKIKNIVGEEVIFIFTSNSQRFPGNYEVIFNVFRPYEFKLKRIK